MFHIRLIKARSYSGIVSATREKPDVFVKDGTIANAAMATGFFEFVEGDGVLDTTGEQGNEDETGEQGKTLDEMNKSELETFAAYKDVDIKGAKTKADIIGKLKEALPPEELDGIIVYGSPTMTELQKEIAN